MLTIRYFAWIAEHVGLVEEQVRLPVDVTTVDALITVITARGGGFALAFADLNRVRVAVDFEMVDISKSLAGASEVAFFPPVTGG